MEETGYNWHGNEVIWDHYQDKWTLPPAEAREEYEDAEYPPATAREEYEDTDEYHNYCDEDEEGYYDAQIAIYNEYEYDAADEDSEFNGPSWATLRDDEYADYVRPAEAREEYEEEYDEDEFPAGDVQEDGYDEDWMGPRVMPEKRVRFPAEAAQDDEYDEDWMGPRSSKAEYLSAHQHGEASIEDWIPAPLEPPAEATPEMSTPWQQQVSQARGELITTQQYAWYPSTAPATYETPVAMDTSAGRACLRAIAAKFPTASRLGALTTAKQEDEGQRGHCPRKEGNVAFTPEMPEEFLQGDEVRVFGAMTQEHWEAWRHIEAMILGISRGAFAYEPLSFDILRNTVAVQPERDPRSDQKYMQDNPQWDREVHGATAVLEDLLEKWKEEPYARDHVRVGHAVSTRDPYPPSRDYQEAWE
ncbi:hypothetical protein EDB89DRAFT_1910168 [Lactarius sanguifluus]|nr:hypothetical protein EDB89DRAFT_1910168 [Lactarius sanguifluus]